MPVDIVNGAFDEAAVEEYPETAVEEYPVTAAAEEYPGASPSAVYDLIGEPIVLSDDSIHASDDDSSSVISIEDLSELTALEDEVEPLGELIVPESVSPQPLASAADRNQPAQPSGRVPFSCTSCSKAFDGSDAFNKHECTSRKTKYRAELWSCGHCAMPFVWQANVQKHLRLCHGSMNHAAITPLTRLRRMYIWYCTLCYYTASDRQYGLKHLFYIHGTNDAQLLRSLHEWQDPAKSPPNDDRPLLCDYCQGLFSDRSLLNTHQRNAHDAALTADRIARCSKCPALFADPNVCQLHMIKAHGCLPKEFLEPLECIECSEPVRSRTAYLSHMKMHLNAKSSKYACCFASCADTYDTIDELTAHMNKHPPSNVVRRTCLGCRRAFSEAQFLKHHCASSSRAGDFADASMQVPKADTHKYVCDHCGKRLNTSRGLRRHAHMHQVTGEHKCDRCPKAFYRERDLRRHIQMHGYAQ